MAQKTWNDFTNGELISAYSNSFNFKLKRKLLKIIEGRGITLSDMYYGNYDKDCKNGKFNSSTTEKRGT